MKKINDLEKKASVKQNLAKIEKNGKNLSELLVSLPLLSKEGGLN